MKNTEKYETNGDYRYLATMIINCYRSNPIAKQYCKDSNREYGQGQYHFMNALFQAVDIAMQYGETMFFYYIENNEVFAAENFKCERILEKLGVSFTYRVYTNASYENHKKFISFESLYIQKCSIAEEEDLPSIDYIVIGSDNEEEE